MIIEREPANARDRPTMRFDYCFPGKGWTSVTVPFVPIRELTQAIQVDARALPANDRFGTAELEFLAPSGAHVDPAIFAVQETGHETAPRLLFLSGATSSEGKHSISLPAGSYFTISRQPILARLAPRTDFEIRAGETVKKTIAFPVDVRRVRIECKPDTGHQLKNLYVEIGGFSTHLSARFGLTSNVREVWLPVEPIRVQCATYGYAPYDAIHEITNADGLQILEIPLTCEFLKPGSEIR